MWLLLVMLLLKGSSSWFEMVLKWCGLVLVLIVLVWVCRCMLVRWVEVRFVFMLCRVCMILCVGMVVLCKVWVVFSMMRFWWLKCRFFCGLMMLSLISVVMKFLGRLVRCCIWVRE